MAERKLNSWLAGFLEYTAGIVSPHQMRVWTGLSMLAATVGRRVWCRIQKQELHPNMYILLVGPPGVGKSNSASKGKELMAKITSVKLAPDGITKRAFFTELESAQVPAQVQVHGGVIPGMHAALYAQVEEMGVFCHAMDRDFMLALARLYDCRPTFDYKTQHMGEAHIENAVFNLLGCCTRGYIAEAWSKAVLEQGFPARIIMVYSEELVQREIFDLEDTFTGRMPEEEALFQALVHDLEIISKISGKFIWTAEAKQLLNIWYKGGMDPRPIDVHLRDYCNRRLAHACKLAMLVALSSSDELIIGAEEFIAAKALLLDVESRMAGAMEVLGANPYTGEMEMVVKIVLAQFRRRKAGVPEHVIRQFLYKEVPPQYISALIQGLVLAGRVRVEGEAGKYIFFPLTADVERAAEAESPQEAEE